MGSPDNNDWQSTKKSVLERSSHMFNNSLLSDITFTCGESKRKCFYGHKYVLATSSAVFYALFYGDLAEKNSIIHLSDTDEESFEEFLRFLYTDECKLTPEIAIKVMYLAKKYVVPSLSEKCVEVIENSMTPENVAMILEQAILFDEKEMEAKCWELIDFKTSTAVRSNVFNNISQGTLINLLKRDTLRVREIELFQAVSNWCDQQCREKGSKPTAENRRAVLGDAVHHIRFLLMTQKEFAQHVSSSGLLKDREIISIYEKLNGVENPVIQWTQKERRQPIMYMLQYFTRFDVIVAPGSLWRYGGSPDSLCFTANKPVTFHGVRLFGDAKGSSYDVRLDVNGKKVSGTYIAERNDKGIYGFDVMLQRPIVVNQNTKVEMAAYITGPASYYGNSGRPSVEVEGIKVTFIGTANESSNGTDVLMGQFYQIILSKR